MVLLLPVFSSFILRFIILLKSFCKSLYFTLLIITDNYVSSLLTSHHITLEVIIHLTLTTFSCFLLAFSSVLTFRITSLEVMKHFKLHILAFLLVFSSVFTLHDATFEVLQNFKLYINRKLT